MWTRDLETLLARPSGAMPDRAKDIARFLAKVDRGADDECWP